jgi:MFS family permease
MLPSIAMITLLSARAGAVAARIGPRRPMTVGPLVAAAGTAWLATVDGAQPYVVDVLPGSLLLGLGMATTVAPLTATVLAAAPDALAGAASGVNNAVARAAQLLAVAALPVAVGLGGSDYTDPAAFPAGYRAAVLACAALFALGGALAWATVRDDVLRT